MRKFFNPTLLVGIFIGAAVACGGSSSTAVSSTGVTEAELSALKAQLRIQVMQLHPALATTSLRTYSFGGSATVAPAATTAAPISLGTSCGYDAPYPRTTQACIVDAQGVSVVVPYPTGGAYAEMYPVFYDQAGCLGNAFVQLGPTTLTAAPSSGAIVFRVDPFSKGTGDATTYYHISAGVANTQLTVQSEAQADGNCIATSFPGPVGMLPITQGVTGTWAASPTGPLATGTPQ